MNNAVVFLISYLIGSFPTAYLLDENIFKKGTRNMGAYNHLISNDSLLETLLVMSVDVLKGVLIVLLAQCFKLNETSLIISVITGIIGHDYSIWVNFKGGKGLALLTGGLLMLKPSFLIVMYVISGFLFILLREKNKAGLLSIPFIAVTAYFMNLSSNLLTLLTTSCLLIIHKDVIRIVKSNIQCVD